MTTRTPAQSTETSPTSPEAASELALQLRTDALFEEMAAVARERCAHLFEGESDSDSEIESARLRVEATRAALSDAIALGAAATCCVLETLYVAQCELAAVSGVRAA